MSIPTVVVGGVSSQAGLASIIAPRPFAGIPLTNQADAERDTDHEDGSRG